MLRVVVFDIDVDTGTITKVHEMDRVQPPGCEFSTVSKWKDPQRDIDWELVLRQNTGTRACPVPIQMCCKVMTN